MADRTFRCLGTDSDLRKLMYANGIVAHAALRNDDLDAGLEMAHVTAHVDRDVQVVRYLGYRRVQGAPVALVAAGRVSQIAVYRRSVIVLVADLTCDRHASRFDRLNDVRRSLVALYATVHAFSVHGNDIAVTVRAYELFASEDVVVHAIELLVTEGAVLGFDSTDMYLVYGSRMAFDALRDADLKRLPMARFTGHLSLIHLLLVEDVRVLGVTGITVDIL